MASSSSPDPDPPSVTIYPVRDGRRAAVNAVDALFASIAATAAAWTTHLDGAAVYAIRRGLDALAAARAAAGDGGAAAASQATAAGERWRAYRREEAEVIRGWIRSGRAAAARAERARDDAREQWEAATVAADGHSRAAVGVASDLGDAAVASQPAALVGGAALAFAGLTRRPRAALAIAGAAAYALRDPLALQLGPTLLTASGAASNSLRSLAAAAGLDDDAPPPREARP